MMRTCRPESWNTDFSAKVVFSNKKNIFFCKIKIIYFNIDDFQDFVNLT